MSNQILAWPAASRAVNKFKQMASNQYDNVRKAYDRRNLEAELAKIIAVSNAHRKAGLPKHAPAHQALWNKAESAIHKFSIAHNVATEELYTQVPALGELKEWGSVDHSMPPSVLATIGLFAGGALVFLAGLGTGLIEKIFHYGYHLVH